MTLDGIISVHRTKTDLNSPITQMTVFSLLATTSLLNNLDLLPWPKLTIMLHMFIYPIKTGTSKAVILKYKLQERVDTVFTSTKHLKDLFRKAKQICIVIRTLYYKLAKLDIQITRWKEYSLHRELFINNIC
jgi:hypothetical protein